MYNVGRYLPDFFASLERQTYGLDRVQVVLVDDGSTDDTLRIARAFASGRPNVSVISKPNAGQASARNLGMANAAGEWLTFPDPDDVLSDRYFETVARVLETHSGAADAAMVSTRLKLWFEDSNSVKDTHALGARFRGGVRVANLDDEPEWIQPHITSGFVRSDVVRAARLDFPEELRLRFEDGNFVSRYLLHCQVPTVVFVPDAEYLYRQRADMSSTIQSSAANPQKYTDTIRFGFMGVVEEAARLGRGLPRWAQNLFLYDQFWILRSSQTNAVRQATYPESMYSELQELLPMFLGHVDDEAIAGFNLMPVAPWMREALLLAKRGGGHGPVYLGAVDSRRGLAPLTYRHFGAAPGEQVLADGRPIEPRYVSTHALEYVGRPLIWQRTLWVPDDIEVELRLDGETQDEPLRTPVVPPRAFGSSMPLARRAIRAATPVARRVRDSIRRRRGRNFVALLRRDLAVASRRLAERYRGAWAFIDRDVDANDSAEDLYWWMREHHPEINSWFVVRADTPDWVRMSAHGARLVAYGSPEFYALLKNAHHLASSHADRFITDALPPKHRPASYAFTFLQHGVIKGDISRWLNPKRIDVFVTSTQDEYEYLAGPSPYRYGPKEVRLTGLPRFDALKALSDRVDEDQRRLIVVMPTWRDYLVGAMLGASDERATLDDFESTTYAKCISALLQSSALAETARTHDHRIVFMPHPNMHMYLDRIDVPDHVEVLSYSDADVRQILCHAALLVTDYSSTAFNAAYLRVPVVYFQFDRDAYFAGHTERRGYFDYDTHGFGPVCGDLDATVSTIAGILGSGLADEYVSRIERTFPVRDGRNRERVFLAMQEAATRRSLEERSISAAPDSWSSVSAGLPNESGA